MRILLVNGAHRRNGFTKELVDLFSEGCTDSGATVDRLDLLDHDINHCRGCFECYSGPHPGKCVHNDDMSDLIERFYKSDGIVLASPVYFYELSSRMKQFIERLFPVTMPKPIYNPTDGLIHNAPRRPERGPDKSVLIAVLAHRDAGGIQNLADAYEKISWAIGSRPVGKLIRPEGPFMDFEASKPKTLRKVRSAFKNAGRAFAKDGFVPSKLETQASLPLTTDSPAFCRHFSNYWEILNESGVKGGDRQAVKAATVEDLRILMPELADSYDPKAVKDLEAVILFELTGTKPQNWHFVIGDDTCEAYQGSADNPDITIKSTSETIVDMILQRLDMRKALVRKEIELFGKKSLFTRFGRLFPPRSV